MYEFIRGRVVSRDAAGVVVETGGIGYRIHVAPRTARDLPGEGEATVYLHQSVREDGVSWFGFATVEDRNLFRTLLKVKGLGPKGCMAVLSGLTRQEFLRALGHRDVKALTRVKGIGKKTAERILVELGDRIPALPLDQDGEEAAASPANVFEGAALALRSLGVEPERVRSALDAAVSAGEADGSDLEKLVRAALRRV